MNAQELAECSDAIGRMIFITKHREPTKEEVASYLETLHELTFDEFTAGILRARKKKGNGYTPTDGEIYQEAMSARRQSFDARTSEATSSRALGPVRKDWSDSTPATIAELVESYGAAAALAKANHNQALREWQRCMPGDPALGDIMERRIKYRSDYHAHLRTQAVYQKLLEDGQEEQPRAGDWFEQLEAAASTRQGRRMEVRYGG